MDSLDSKPLESRSYPLAFAGEPTSILGLWLKHVFLTLVTIGIYGFWARAEMRRYLWSHTSVGGDRLVWTGTGKETFRGFLKIAAIFVGLSLIRAALEFVLPGQFKVIAEVLFPLAIAGVAPWFLVRAYRYRMSRTHYRGIRFRFRGTAKEAYQVLGKSALLMICTLGLYYPALKLKWRRFLLTNTSWGQMPVHFNGEVNAIYELYLKSAILILLTLGIYTFWHQAALRRFFHNHTSIGGLQMKCTLQGDKLLMVGFSGLVLVPLTLGIAFPWIFAWRLREVIGSVSLEGHVDFAAVEQAEASAIGAGADAMDDDGFDGDLFG